MNAITSSNKRRKLCKPHFPDRGSSAAPQSRSRHRKTPAPDDAGTETDTPVSPGPFANFAAQLEAEASEDRHRAAAKRAEARAKLDAAEAEAQRLVADATREAQHLTGDADGDESHAHALQERARLITRADALRERAEKTERQAGALADERQGLTAQLAGLDARLTHLGGEKERLAAELATARASGDLAGMTSARNGLQSVEDLAADVTSPRAGLVRRIDGIGDGDGSAEFADIFARAVALRAEAWEALGALLEGGNLTAEARAAIPQARDEETARCAAVLATERERVSAVAAELPALLEVLQDEAEEIDRRQAVPLAMRSLASSVMLRQHAEGLESFASRIGAAATGAQACLQRLDTASPDELADVLAAALRTRQEIRRLLDIERPPLGEDDLGDIGENLNETVRQMLEPEPVEPHRVMMHDR